MLCPLIQLTPHANTPPPNDTIRPTRQVHVNQDGQIEVNEPAEPAVTDGDDAKAAPAETEAGQDSGIGEPLDSNGTANGTTANGEPNAAGQQRTEIADCVDSSTVAIAGDSVLLNGDASVLEISEPAEPTSPAKPARRSDRSTTAATETAVVVPADQTPAVEETLSVQCAPTVAAAVVDSEACNIDESTALDDEQVRQTREPRLLCCCAHASYEITYYL